jgi:glucose uptake protein
LADVARTGSGPILLAAAGGVVFNVANVLLVAAIDVAGLAVAFPVGIGLALVVGAVSSYLVRPAANPLLLFGGVALVMVAIVLDAAAYRQREGSTKTGERSATTTRGIVLSLAAGVLMGCFYPLVARAMSGTEGLPGPGPYATALFLRPRRAHLHGSGEPAADGQAAGRQAPVDGSGYGRAPLGWHLAGLLGGAVWCTGTIANFVASGAHFVGPAVSYSIGQGATMVSACWGVFVWREFAGAPRAAKLLLLLMFVFFVLGLGAVALAPLYPA